MLKNEFQAILIILISLELSNEVERFYLKKKFWIDFGKSTENYDESKQKWKYFLKWVILNFKWNGSVQTCLNVKFK